MPSKINNFIEEADKRYDQFHWAATYYQDTKPYIFFADYLKKHQTELEASPISFSHFSILLLFIQKQLAIESDVEELLEQHCGTEIIGFSTNLPDRMASILETLMGDEGHYISWWLWESPHHKGAKISVDGKGYPTKTVRNLYDFIVWYGKQPASTRAIME